MLSRRLRLEPGWLSANPVISQTMLKHRPVTRSTAPDDDRAHLDGVSAGGAFGAAEYRSGAELAVGCRRGVEFVECRIRLGG